MLVVGGGFSAAGYLAVDNLVAWDGFNWHKLPTRLNCGVNALTVYHGQLIAAGAYIDGDECARVVERWTGSEWEQIGGQFDRWVLTLAVYNDELIAGGWFTESGGTIVNGIARWDGVTWSPLESGVIADFPQWAEVWSLIVFENDLFAGGHFSEAGGQGASNVARWDGQHWYSTGGIDVGSQFSTGAVTAFSVWDGALFAGADISPPSGPRYGRVLRWDGHLWVPLGDALGRIHSLAVYHDMLIAGGEQPLSGHVSTWDGATWTQLGGDFKQWPPRFLTVFKDEIIAGGGFSEAGDAPARGIARWDGNTWRNLGNLPDYEPYLLGSFKGELVGAGTFAPAIGPIFQGVGRWDGTAWHPMGEPMLGQVSAFAEFNGELVVAGEYLFYDKKRRENILRWDGLAWQPLGSELSFVRTLTIFDGDLVAGSGGSVLRWDGSSWQTLASTGITDDEFVAIATGGPVEALVVYKGELVAGGSFLNIGGRPIPRIARWDGTEWHPLGAGVEGAVTGLAVYDGELIVTEGWNEDLRRWDGSNWHVMQKPWIGAELTLTVYNGELIAGADWIPRESPNYRYIAAWNGESWHGLASGMEDAVTNLIVHGNTLVSAGHFSTAGQQVSHNWARWAPTSTFGDHNGDNLIQLTDFGFLPPCTGGPVEPTAAAATSRECLCVFNADGDSDVDLFDFRAFQNAFGH